MPRIPKRILTSGTRLRERVDAVRDALQLDGRQRRVDRQGEDLVGCLACGRKLQTGGEAGQGGQLVVRNRVVDARADAVLLTQGGGETVAVFGYADRVLVVDVRGTGGDVRDGDTSGERPGRRRCPDVCASTR